MRILLLLPGLVLFAAALPARAHEGGHDARGTVSGVSSGELTLKTKAGEEKFHLTKDTEFVKDGAPATAADLKQGARAVVHAKKKNGRLEAVKVQISAGSHLLAAPPPPATG